MGPQGAGSHAFDFDVPHDAQGQKLTFRVNALNNEAPLDAKSFAFNRINAVSSAKESSRTAARTTARVARSNIAASPRRASHVSVHSTRTAATACCAAVCGFRYRSRP